VFTTHPDAPRDADRNANLVPRFAPWEVFRDLERRGLIMYGQMTAGSWLYIGTQGISRAPTRRSARLARGTSWLTQGRIVLTGGLAAMGGAQPLAATIE